MTAAQPDLDQVWELIRILVPPVKGEEFLECRMCSAVDMSVKVRAQGSSYPVPEWNEDQLCARCQDASDENWQLQWEEWFYSRI